MNDFFGLGVGQVGTWLLVILGWLLVVWNSNRIAGRSEARKICDQVIAQLNGLRDEISKFLNESHDAYPQTLPEDVILYAESRLTSYISFAEFLSQQLRAVSYIEPLSPTIFSRLREDFMHDLELFMASSRADSLLQKAKILNSLNDTLLISAEHIEKEYKTHYTDMGVIKSLGRTLGDFISRYPRSVGLLIAAMALIGAYRSSYFVLWCSSFQ